MPSHDLNPLFRKAVVVGSILVVALVAGLVFLKLREMNDTGGAAQLANGTAPAGNSEGLAIDPAAGGLRLCNQTASRVSVAVGHKLGEVWTTEGWWNVGTENCETIVKGQLVSRFYYLYAVDYDQGGVWGGKAIMCTRDKEFTIEGIADCVARGYERTGFFEVDTGEQQSWTVKLTEPGIAGTGGR